MTHPILERQRVYAILYTKLHYTRAKMQTIIAIAMLLFPYIAMAGGHVDITPAGLEYKTKAEGNAKFIFLFASWCSVCEKSFSEYMQLVENFGKPGMVSFIAVSLDSDPTMLDRFIERFKPGFPVFRLVYQDGREAMASFGRLGIGYRGKVPHASFIDYDGSIFADGGFQYFYYNTVLEFWRDNYLN